MIMNDLVLKGFLSVGGWGENDDALLLDYETEWGETTEPLAEVLSELDGKCVTIRYFISDKKKTRDEIQENFIRKVIGDLEADYHDCYSEYTGYLWTTEELKVGGHDLLKELESYTGKFLILEATIYDECDEIIERLGV